jgi:hypothetical protein
LPKLRSGKRSAPSQPKNGDLRLAVLIDADNVPATDIRENMGEISNYPGTRTTPLPPDAAPGLAPFVDPAGGRQAR